MARVVEKHGTILNERSMRAERRLSYWKRGDMTPQLTLPIVRPPCNEKPIWLMSGNRRSAIRHESPSPAQEPDRRTPDGVILDRCIVNHRFAGHEPPDGRRLCYANLTSI